MAVLFFVHHYIHCLRFFSSIYFFADFQFSFCRSWLLYSRYYYLSSSDSSNMQVSIISTLSHSIQSATKATMQLIEFAWNRCSAICSVGMRTTTTWLKTTHIQCIYGVVDGTIAAIHLQTIELIFEIWRNRANGMKEADKQQQKKTTNTAVGHIGTSLILAFNSRAGGGWWRRRCHCQSLIMHFTLLPWHYVFDYTVKE